MVAKEIIETKPLDEVVENRECCNAIGGQSLRSLPSRLTGLEFFFELVDRLIWDLAHRSLPLHELAPIGGLRRLLSVAAIVACLGIESMV
jgi:hypothetical protein